VLVLAVVLVGVLAGFTGARILRRPASTAGAASMARSVGGTLGARRELDLPHLQRVALSEMLRHVRGGSVPGEFRVRLHPDDKATVDQAPGFFRQGLEEALAKAGRDHGWDVPSHVRIELDADPGRPRGAPAVDARAPHPPSGPAPPPAPEPSAAPARLVRGDGTEHALGPVTTIGRGPDRDIRIDDTRVSRNHAVVRRDGEHWTLTDEGSSNGTRRNGSRVTATTPVRLADGDEIGIGPVTFTFRSGDVGRIGEAGSGS
jgi:hypothetical protein